MTDVRTGLANYSLNDLHAAATRTLAAQAEAQASGTEMPPIPILEQEEEGVSVGIEKKKKKKRKNKPKSKRGPVRFSMIYVTDGLLKGTLERTYRVRGVLRRSAHHSC